MSGVYATLVEAIVYDPLTSSSQTLRFTNRNDDRATAYLGEEWRPILTQSPTLGMAVFDGAFTARGAHELGTMAISLLDGDLDPLPLYNWHGATIKIFAGDLEAGVFPQIFTAVGDGASRQGSASLQIDLTTRDKLLDDANLLYLSYGGIGDIEGTAELTGVLKPFVYGYAKFCQPVLLDPARQIYQVHGYGPIEEITDVFEGGSPIGTDGLPDTVFTLANGNTYASLRDLVVPQGEWASFPDLGLFKLGSQPIFPVSCHARGDKGGTSLALETAADVIKRIVTTTVQGVVVKNSSIAAFNAAQPQPVDGHYTSQISVGEAIEQILLGLGAYWTWNEVGELIFGRVRFGDPDLVLSGNNDRLPDVVSVSQLPTSSPVWQLRYGAEQCHFVHDAASLTQAVLQQIQDDIKVRTRTWPPGSVPPVGAADGDLWPDTGSVPTMMRRYDAATGTWTAVSNYVTQGSHIGVENGADVTGNHTAANVVMVGSRTATAVNNLLTQLETAQAALAAGQQTLDASLNDLWTAFGHTDAQGFRSRVVYVENLGINHASRISGVESTLNTPTSGVLARVGTLESTVVTNNTAISNRVSAVESEISGARYGYSSLSAKIGSFAGTLADALAGKASTTVVNSMQSEIVDARQGAASLNAKIGTVSGTLADALAGKASASTVSSLSATVGNHTGQIMTLQTVTTTIEGVVNSSVTMLVDAGGRMAGYHIHSSNQSFSTMDFLAEVFRFVTPGTAIVPFTLTGSSMQLRAPLLVYDSGNVLRVRIAP